MTLWIAVTLIMVAFIAGFMLGVCSGVERYSEPEHTKRLAKMMLNGDI